MAAADQQSLANPRRVVLWGVPRSLSTVFTKCMSFVDGVQVLNEPYGCALELGPDKIDVPDDYMRAVEDATLEIREKADDYKLPLAVDDSLCTYQWAKETLEGNYQDKKLVFCKDMSRHLAGRFDMLPRGYQHTFIIRDPVKVYQSWRNVLMDFIQLPQEKRDNYRITDLSFAIDEEFKLLTELYHHVTSNCSMSSSPVVIIDADDLQEYPESIIRQYLDAIGIPFQKGMMEWNPSPNIASTWISSKLLMQLNTLETRGGFFTKALASTHFLPPKSPPLKSDLTPDVIACAEASAAFYKELFDLRIKP